jgi:hypothetical protein
MHSVLPATQRNKIHIKSRLNRFHFFFVAETSRQFCSLKTMAILNHYRVAKELLTQINQNKLRVLRSTVIARSAKYQFLGNDLIKVGDNKTAKFIMKLMDAQFQSAIWRHKDLLQRLIDCAMTCQECVFECSKGDHHETSCEVCEMSRKVSGNCFILAKSLIDNTSFSAQLLLQCAETCKEYSRMLKRFPNLSAERCISACKLCAEACVALYRKVGTN